jgi:sugar/nucleoside kinase (ribokinase family)
MSGVVLALGEVLVEVMRDRTGEPLDTPGTFRGPYASGAPAIFAGAAARLGARARFLGRRGNDRFGSLCQAKLAELGVDTERLLGVPERITGVAFVGYQEGGGREFLFHLPESAAASLGPGDLDDALFTEVAWLHLSGSSLGVSESVRAACYRAAAMARSRGAVVSFDPNLRPELMTTEAAAALCRPVLEHADVVLPSGAEAALLTGSDDPEDACRALLAQGAELVVLKRGAEGALLYSTDEVRAVPAVEVDEVDPTGAGDCFAAAFAVARLHGWTPYEAARFANVAAALSTTRFGPMEGLPRRAEVEDLLRRSVKADSGVR